MDEQVTRQGDWFVLADPAAAEPPVPPGLMVGGWPILADGTAGPFRPNPAYRPSGPLVPTDPIDAILRRIARGETDLGDSLLATVADTVVELGCDTRGRPLLGDGPTGAPCAVVATAEVQKSGVDVDRWIPVHGVRLPEVLAGVEILLNPAGVAPFLLAARREGGS